MQHLGPGQAAGILGIAVVLAAAVLLALAMIGDARRARRAGTSRRPERWKRQ